MNNYVSAIIGLFRHDYSAEYHLRQIAGFLKASHVTLLPHINKILQSKLLTARLVGKSKLFSLNLENILAKDNVLLSEIQFTTAILEKNFLLKKIYTEIFTLAPEGAVVLFGSYAKQTEDENSDIDLLYIGENRSEFSAAIKKLGALYGKDINVKIISLEKFESALRGKDALVCEILKNHLLLYCPSVFVDCVWRYYSEIR